MGGVLVLGACSGGPAPGEPPPVPDATAPGAEDVLTLPGEHLTVEEVGAAARALLARVERRREPWPAHVVMSDDRPPRPLVCVRVPENRTGDPAVDLRAFQQRVVHVLRHGGQLCPVEAAPGGLVPSLDLRGQVFELRDETQRDYEVAFNLVDAESGQILVTSSTRFRAREE